MNLLIIGFIVLSLVGSVMWVMPSKRDRFLAELRLNAKKKGYQVQLTKILFPREEGEMEAKNVSTVAYRLSRGKISREQHDNWVAWRVVRCQTNAKEGLPEGWGWSVGERELAAEELSSLSVILESLPKNVIGLESTPVQVSVFWQEDDADELILIEQALNKLIDETF